MPPALTPYPKLTTLYPQVSGATAAWAQGLTGKNISVAVLDSGIDKNADAIDDGQIEQVSLPGQPGGDKLTDKVGHGTFVSDVLAAHSKDGRYVGVAPGLQKIYELNVTSADGSLYTSDIVSGLAWVLANAPGKKIRVVNLSLAETVPSSYQMSALDQAVETLWRAGIVVVTTSGNNGPDSVYYAPGNDPYVITVGASDSNDTVDPSDDYVASFSSSGVTADGIIKPEILAPGRHIISNIPAGSTLDTLAPAANHVEPGYLMANGTSFAAPQVAGAAAILLQKYPALTPDQIKWLLAASGRPVAQASATTGAPGLDLATALAYNGPVQSANQGLVPSTGPAVGLLNSAALNTNASKDAIKLTYDAVDKESKGKLADAAKSWNSAGDSWGLGANFIKAAVAYDRRAPTTRRPAAASTRLPPPGPPPRTPSPRPASRSGRPCRSSSPHAPGWRRAPTATPRS